MADQQNPERKSPPGISPSREIALREFELWGEVERYGGRPAFEKLARCSRKANPKHVAAWLLTHAQVDGFVRRVYGENGIKNCRRRWAEFTFSEDEAGKQTKQPKSIPAWLENETNRYVGAFARAHVSKGGRITDPETTDQVQEKTDETK